MDDATILPVELSRIAGMLDDLDLTFTQTSSLDDCPVALVGETICTGFTNLMVFIDIEADALRFRGCWRGHPPASGADHALKVANQWNVTQISPRLAIHLNGDDTIDFLLTRVWPTATGASEAQLSNICRASLSSLSSCAEWLDKHYLTLSAAWKE